MLSQPELASASGVKKKARNIPLLSTEAIMKRLIDVPTAGRGVPIIDSGAMVRQCVSVEYYRQDAYLPHRETHSNGANSSCRADKCPKPTAHRAAVPASMQEEQS